MKRLPQPLTQDQLRDMFQYDPETGAFRHRTAMNRHKPGDRAGSHGHSGYRKIVIFGVRYYEHHLAWLYMTGRWDESVDHANRDPSDNRWSNLRQATASQQQANRGKNKNNTVGLRGVSFCRTRQKFAAYLTKDRKRRFLGYFDTPEDAHSVYAREAYRAFGPYACVV
jgi:hypothetical protein